MFDPVSDEDTRLVAAAEKVLRENLRPPKHTVGAAVLCGSGRVYTGVNLDATGYGPCAEPIALGTAISAGEREFTSIVAVSLDRAVAQILSPCGNCRQLLLEYAPDIDVVLEHSGALCKTPARNLLPEAYHPSPRDS